MNRLHLLLRNLLYFRGVNLALIAGMIVATAVLTGAMMVGDSVRDAFDPRYARLFVTKEPSRRTARTAEAEPASLSIMWSPGSRPGTRFARVVNFPGRGWPFRADIWELVHRAYQLK